MLLIISQFHPRSLCTCFSTLFLFSTFRSSIRVSHRLVRSVCSALDLNQVGVWLQIAESTDALVLCRHDVSDFLFAYKNINKRLNHFNSLWVSEFGAEIRSARVLIRLGRRQNEWAARSHMIGAFSKNACSGPLLSAAVVPLMYILAPPIRCCSARRSAVTSLSCAGTT